MALLCLAGAVLLAACGRAPAAAGSGQQRAGNSGDARATRDAADVEPDAQAPCATARRPAPTEPSSTFLCLDEPKEGARIAGTLRVSGEAASPARSDLVVTLVDAHGNVVVLVGLPPPRAPGAAPWGTTVSLPASATAGAAVLRVYIGSAQGSGALATRRLWIEAPAR